MFASPQSLERTGLNEVYKVKYGDNKGIFAEFEIRPIHQEYASKMEGRAIYKDVIYITERFAGDKNKVIVRPAKLAASDPMDTEPTDPQRYPKQWELFQQQKEQIGEGLPVTEWPPITKSQAQELKAMNIHTVEQLALMADSGLNWLGARGMRDLAKAWLDDGEASKIVAENQKLKNDMAVLQQQMSMLIAERQKSDLDKTITPVAAAIFDEYQPKQESSLTEMPESALVKRKAGRPKQTKGE